jgi:hypothetical protein
MNSSMWAHPITAKQIRLLEEEWGVNGVNPDEGWIENVIRVGRPKIDTLPSVEAFRRVRDVDPLKVGDLMPDYRFTNELGRAVNLKDFKGKALALTFIFTRCPFPEFCPRMSNNFAEAYKRLMTTPNAPTNWHLLSISFDPANDTPAVLKAYAGRYNYDSNHWSFLTGAKWPCPSNRPSIWLRGRDSIDAAAALHPENRRRPGSAAINDALQDAGREEPLPMALSIRGVNNAVFLLSAHFCNSRFGL